MQWIVTENDLGLCPGLQLSDLPEKIPPNVHVIHQNGSLGIMSENVAGILPCKNGHEIIIEPKYQDIQPVDLMTYIGNISGIVLNRERIQSGSSEISMQSIANAFVDQLNIIKSLALKFKRKSTAAIIDHIAGKVNWLKTYQIQSAGRKGEIATIQKTASLDIPENAIIAAAAIKVIHFFARNSSEYDVLYPWVCLAEKYPHSYHDLFLMQKKLNELSLSGAHAFYYSPVMLSKMILGFTGSDVLSEEVDTLIFNMPGLYEDYIRTGFQRAGHKYGFSVQKGLVPRAFLLYNGECELIPDIVVYDGAQIKAIMDVKYKTPDSKDYYQIFSYMKYCSVDEMSIISPAVPADQTVTTFDGSRIHFIQIKSSNPIELESKVDEFFQTIH